MGGLTVPNDGSSSLAWVHHFCDGMCRVGGTGRRSIEDDHMHIFAQQGVCVVHDVCAVGERGSIKG